MGRGKMTARPPRLVSPPVVRRVLAAHGAAPELEDGGLGEPELLLEPRRRPRPAHPVVHELVKGV